MRGLGRPEKHDNLDNWVDFLAGKGGLAWGGGS